MARRKNFAPRKKPSQRIIIHSNCFRTSVQVIPIVPRKSPRGSVAQKEVKFYQKSTDNLIPKAPFARLVKELAQDWMMPFIFRKDAMDAIQEAAETFLVDLFRKGLIIANRGKRATLHPDDLKTVLAVMGISGNDS